MMLQAGGPSKDPEPQDVDAWLRFWPRERRLNHVGCCGGGGGDDDGIRDGGGDGGGRRGK